LEAILVTSSITCTVARVELSTVVLGDLEVTKPAAKTIKAVVMEDTAKDLALITEAAAVADGGEIMAIRIGTRSYATFVDSALANML
jgi:hypothetical protein